MPTVPLNLELKCCMKPRNYISEVREVHTLDNSNNTSTACEALARTPEPHDNAVTAKVRSPRIPGGTSKQYRILHETN